MTVTSRGKMLDYWARAETGPVCFEKEFDYKRYWPLLKKITKKYGIEYDPKKCVPEDDDFLEALWKAGYEFFLECGIFVSNTERLIMFQEQEVKDAIRNVPEACVVGEDYDQIVMKYREFEDYESGKNPVGQLGRILGPISDDIYDATIMSYLKEPLIDFFHFQGVVTSVNGALIKPYSPFELMSELKRMHIVNDCRRRAGRPGASDGASMPCTLQGEMVASDLVKKGDVRHVYVMPHLKTDYDQMSRAFMWHQFGAKTWGIMQAYIGGGSGGPATSVVQSVADQLAYMMLYEVSQMGCFISDALYFSNTSNTVMFVGLNGCAAFQKYTKWPATLGPGWQMTAGLGAEEYFWEHVSGAIGNCVLGLANSGGTAKQSAALDHVGGLGARFASEVGYAVGQAKLTRKQANELINKNMLKYNDQIVARTIHLKGGDFRECYDVKTACPQKWYVDMYEKVKAELRSDYGLPML